ncbi:MAG: hypothetical protein D6748_07760 [Calditrichaeota bacterium]|nr:MAG: hypothetical protein D6748_07760 [Calditrichota bacterium]
MKQAKFIRNVISGLLCLSLLILIGCHQNPISGEVRDQDLSIRQSDLNLQEYCGKGGNRDSLAFPLVATKVFPYNPNLNEYAGGEIRFNDNYSSFILKAGTLIPPPDHPWGDDISISMTIEMDSTNGELRFSFSPDGCVFTEPAILRMDYRLMCSGIPNLYYIDEQGEYIGVDPGDIKVNHKWIEIKIHHFSRYALVYA